MGYLLAHDTDLAVLAFRGFKQISQGLTPKTRYTVPSDTTITKTTETMPLAPKQEHAAATL